MWRRSARPPSRRSRTSSSAMIAITRAKAGSASSTDSRRRHRLGLGPVERVHGDAAPVRRPVRPATTLVLVEAQPCRRRRTRVQAVDRHDGSPPPGRRGSPSGGGCGIRTHGGPQDHNGFRDRPIRPLWHPSGRRTLPIALAALREEGLHEQGGGLLGPHAGDDLDLVVAAGGRRRGCRACRARPAFGSDAPNTSRSTRAATSAPAHIGQGSTVTTTVAPVQPPAVADRRRPRRAGRGSRRGRSDRPASSRSLWRRATTRSPTTTTRADRHVAVGRGGAGLLEGDAHGLGVGDLGHRATVPGGGSGIRTHGGLPHTRFPSVPIRPLSHPSRASTRPALAGGGQAICGTPQGPLRAAASRP